MLLYHSLAYWEQLLPHCFVHCFCLVVECVAHSQGHHEQESLLVASEVQKQVEEEKVAAVVMCYRTVVAVQDILSPDYVAVGLQMDACNWTVAEVVVVEIAAATEPVERMTQSEEAEEVEDNSIRFELLEPKLHIAVHIVFVDSLVVVALAGY